ncbi:hypothetical protein [Pseudorhodoplanes sp.]|uniref:hypothetical protein n=1 Tax=Pseudorhodoplanes sp. TaxID=1934341 RepID=UPI003D0ED5DA
MDHYVLLIYPTVVIGLEVNYARTYGELMALSTTAFIAFGVFSLPAGWLPDRIAQLAVGRLVERIAPHLLFVIVTFILFVGAAWSVVATGPALLVALALAMAGVYGQVTVNDIVLARYTADAWRGRVYAVRYFLVFTTAGVAVASIAFLHARGGFDLVLLFTAGTCLLFLAATLGLAAMVSGAERRSPIAVPAE